MGPKNEQHALLLPLQVGYMEALVAAGHRARHRAGQTTTLLQMRNTRRLVKESVAANSQVRIQALGSPLLKGAGAERRAVGCWTCSAVPGTQ